MLPLPFSRQGEGRSLSLALSLFCPCTSRRAKALNEMVNFPDIACKSRCDSDRSARARARAPAQPMEPSFPRFLRVPSRWSEVLLRGLRWWWWG